MYLFLIASEVYGTLNPANTWLMADQILIPLQRDMFPDTWKDSLADKFSTSLYAFARDHGWPALASQLPELAEITIQKAEARSGRILDHQFLRIVALALGVQFMTTTIANIVSECAAICESPIELAFLFALVVAGRQGSCGVVLSFPTSCIGDLEADFQLIIRPQAHVGEYRVDFLLTAQFADAQHRIHEFERPVIIEADGFEFHDKTREQSIRDRKRDRDLQAQGFSVFRYAGSEIWANPFRCAEEVLLFVIKGVERQNASAESRKPPEKIQAVSSAHSAAG